ncbi:hypothetical protein A2W14_04035 [Candidatus Gottesmanbacteria bacterium RBG_16_37_8]|uniref:Ferric oxidoreductase domain-containing protein n=1 Tax=Candidatus Gottesmanbacteria bacterium RBG_16_37_8 TaxID=1798371 RepID=A0A1F5YU87_9BACT|nr:MAG: hypothetical protein A2W14_04035 [Candidatus Gottesmanbacteria bacterium RBG_16_37_8]
MLNRFFQTAVARKIAVIKLFYLLWLIILFFFFQAASSVINQNSTDYKFWYPLAVNSGRLSLIFFIIVLLPGIFNRFRVRNKMLGLIRIFRRHLGITMFLLAAFHGLIVSLLPKIKSGPPFAINLFEIFGSFSLFLLFFLFITSNDFSEKFLKIWWYRLHRLVYLIMWLILFHTALQRLSLWSLLAGALVVAEITAIIYSHLKKS